MKSVSHSEARWALLPEHVVRCNGHMVNGGRCKREAEPGSVVCRLHGGAAPQVRRRAGERLTMSADHASQKLLEWLDDPEVAIPGAGRDCARWLGEGPPYAHALTRTRVRGSHAPSVEGASDEPHVGKQHVVSRVLAAQSG